MDFKLKHGTFEADCKICNRAFSLTLAQCEREDISITSGSLVANSLFIQTYAYFSYAVAFTSKGSRPPLSLIDFDEVITSSQKDSNLADLIEALGDNILSRLRESQENKEELTEDEKKRSPKKGTTNSKASTADKSAST